jgi:hypothetical protein
MRQLFDIDIAVETRLWLRLADVKGWLISPTSYLTVQDAKLRDGDTLVIERKRPDGTWTLEYVDFVELG